MWCFYVLYPRQNNGFYTDIYCISSLSMNTYNNFTVEETNLLSIYMTGSKEGLLVAMNAALPFMEGEMRDFAARTLAKVGRMTEAEFAGLALYPADEV